jgi:hypothetical protein
MLPYIVKVYVFAAHHSSLLISLCAEEMKLMKRQTAAGKNNGQHPEASENVDGVQGGVQHANDWNELVE